jgi:hypothetical protein
VGWSEETGYIERKHPLGGCRCITADMICRPSVFIFRTYQRSALPRAYSVRTDAGAVCQPTRTFTAAAFVQDTGMTGDGTPENAELVHLDHGVDYTTRMSSHDEVVGST